MAVEVFTSFDQQFDGDGAIVSGALVYVYSATTTTPKTVYTDAALTVVGNNPIVCDSAGRHDMRYVATGSYKVVVKTSAGVTVYTRDNVDGRVPVGSGALAIANGGTAATTAGTALSNLGAATAAELALLAADLATLSGTLSSTEKTHIATGTTAQRPAVPVDGDIRKNSTTNRYEFYLSAWTNVLTQLTAAADLAASDASAGVVQIAVQADLEAATSNVLAVTPGRTQYHPGVAKVWVYVTYAAGAPSAIASHNVSSLTDTGVGICTVNLTTSFSSANYAVQATAELFAARISYLHISNKATGSFRVNNFTATAVGDTSSVAADNNFSAVAYGDQ